MPSKDLANSPFVPIAYNSVSNFAANCGSQTWKVKGILTCDHYEVLRNTTRTTAFNASKIDPL